MTPNLRCAFAQGWRSIRSRRSFSSSPGSRGEKKQDLLAAALVQSKKSISYVVTGFGIYCFYDFTHLYSLVSKRKKKLALLAEEKEIMSQRKKSV
ncbi:unnamed protein product [Microthlaspi erraticum]|uniref:Uncharacterized protein n=1 Tax=Microthlaspi erraticum TaxID=1685480 RepID=A0A6D2JHS3_9BRAS|nr:unnamed protein product [Microthlaspi erraticum]